MEIPSDMRRTRIAWLTAAGVGLLFGACASGPGTGRSVIVRQHFAGLTGIGGRPDLASVQAVLALPESRRLMDGTAAKLAADLPRWFGIGGTEPTNGGGVSPGLVRDLLGAESYLEVQGNAERVEGWALAARLDPAAAERAGLEVGRVLAGRLAVAAPTDAKGGWDLSGGAGNTRARFAVANGWAVFGRGVGAFERVREAIQASGAPEAGWSNTVFRIEADLSAVSRLLGWRAQPPGPVDQWPSVDLAVEPRSGRLRTEARLRYPQPLGLVMDAWQIPTNLLREPLVGFTAVRGADTWVGRLGLLEDLGIKEWPRQLFLWSLAGPAWQQYFSGPLDSPTNLMNRVANDLPMKVMTNAYWKGQTFGLRVTNNASRIEMHGLPYFQPFLEAIPGRGTASDQVHGGLFRLPARNAPPPNELLSQITGRTNLVIYDWETTGSALLLTNAPGTRGPAVVTNFIGRLVHFKHLYQFIKMSTAVRPSRLPSNAAGAISVPGGEWIDAAVPLLGDTVTEVTRTGPAELAAVRQSRLGFSALEIIHLLRWIENPGFPGWQEPPAQTADDPAPAGAKPAGTGAAPAGARPAGRP